MGMTNSKFTLVHYDLLYKSIMSRHGGGHMPMEVFFDAMERVADELYPFELERLEHLVGLIAFK